MRKTATVHLLPLHLLPQHLLTFFYQHRHPAAAVRQHLTAVSPCRPKGREGDLVRLRQSRWWMQQWKQRWMQWWMQMFNYLNLLLYAKVNSLFDVITSLIISTLSFLFNILYYFLYLSLRFVIEIFFCLEVKVKQGCEHCV